MITRSTTFVIGAGASKCCGLPLGWDMVDDARRMGKSGSGVRLLLNALADSGYGSKDDLIAFIKTINFYTGPSIDDLLEHQPAFRNLGRLVIAALMAQAVLGKPFRMIPENRSDDWLGFVIERMLRGSGSDLSLLASAGHRVAFVTFNFDTIIEDRLVYTVMTTYGVTEERAKEVLASVEVVHVHGALPPRPEFTPDWVRRASEQIRIVHDDLNNDTTRRARELIARADTVCFLGFSYQRQNMNTLNLPNVVKKDAQVFGSAYDLPISDMKDVTRLFWGHPIGGKEPVLEALPCRDFLAHHDIIETIPIRALTRIERAALKAGLVE